MSHDDRRHQRLIYLRGAARSAEIRTATFNDTPHLVIPIVALIGDSVVRPLHSEGPEFVPAEELAVAPSAWDGRPVVPDHPDNGRASANKPRTLESYSYGQIFNTEFSAGRLRTEAWVDPAKADRIGGEASRVAAIARRALEGEDVEMIEVSVGAWVSLVKETGVSPSGVAYEYRWNNVVPDHLAVGLNGSEGACSVEMGCGGPRTMAGSDQRPTSASDVQRPTTNKSGSFHRPTTNASRPVARLRAATRRPTFLLLRNGKRFRIEGGH